MKIELQGTYDEIRAQVAELFPEDVLGCALCCAEDFEEDISTSGDKLDKIRAMVRYSESKDMYVRVSDMHIYHILASMKNMLKNNSYTDIAQSETFQSLAINFIDKVVED